MDEKGNQLEGRPLNARSSAKKRKGPKRTLTLYSPANLVALLVLSYPDPKYRHWLGRLQMDWMMRDRVCVREGFWKGLTRDDLAKVFQLSDLRLTEAPLAADYNRRFGRQFKQAIVDIRPFLPAWAKSLNLHLATGPSVTKTCNSATSPSAHARKAGDAASLASPPDVGAVDLDSSDELIDLDDLSSVRGFSDVEMRNPSSPDTTGSIFVGTTETAGLEATAELDSAQLSTLDELPAADADETDEDPMGWLVEQIAASNKQDVLSTWLSELGGPDEQSTPLRRSSHP